VFAVRRNNIDFCGEPDEDACDFFTMFW